MLMDNAFLKWRAHLVPLDLPASCFSSYRCAVCVQNRIQNKTERRACRSGLTPLVSAWTHCFNLLSSTSDQCGLFCVSRDLNPLFLSASVLDTGFPGGSVCKESACDAGDPGSIPGSGRCPGGGPGNPLRYSWTVACQVPLPMASQELDQSTD